MSLFVIWNFYFFEKNKFTLYKNWIIILTQNKKQMVETVPNFLQNCSTPKQALTVPNPKVHMCFGGPCCTLAVGRVQCPYLTCFGYGLLIIIDMFEERRLGEGVFFSLARTSKTWTNIVMAIQPGYRLLMSLDHFSAEWSHRRSTMFVCMADIHCLPKV